ncbi:hypothetical protein HED60_14255 [Planctomycetales bacterium ZRK34]|nr:hypothetical protein HED60_14255 [Planctomycetales bacterium ZRK34]
MQRCFLLTIVTLALMLPLPTRAAEQAAPAEGPNAAQADQLERALAADDEALYTYWPAQLYLGGKVGTERSLGEVNVMAPVWQHDTGSLFVDLRSRFDDNDSQEYNLGGGYRHVLNKDMIIGFYGFFDVLHTEFENNFLQGTVGAELLMEDWRVRANGYLPESKQETVGNNFGATTASIVGNSILISTPSAQFFERALSGYDVEIGRRFPVFNNDLWVYAAYFNFHEDNFPRVEGPRLRAEYLIPLGPIDVLPEGSHAIVGGEWQHDNVRGSQAFATFGIRIPLGSDPHEAPPTMSQDWKYWAMISRIQRDIDLVTSNRSVDTTDMTTEVATNPVSGTQYGGIYFAQDGAAGVGTSDDPSDLTTAEAAANAAGTGVLVVDGNFATVDGISVMANGTLVGGGSTLVVQDSAGNNYNLAIPGSASTLTAIAGGTANTLTIDNADNVLVQDITIVGTDLRAISASNDTNLNFTRVSVGTPAGGVGGSFTGDGIVLDSIDGFNMIGNPADRTATGVFNVTGDGLAISNSDGMRTLQDVTIFAVGAAGTGLNLNSNAVGSTTQLNNVLIRDAGSATIALIGTTETVNIASSSDVVQTQDGVAIVAIGGDVNFTLDGTSALTATNGTGISMDATSGMYNFNGTVILNNAVGGATANATLAIDDFDGQVTFDDLTINNPFSRTAVAIGIGETLTAAGPGNIPTASFTFNDLTVTTNGTNAFVADNSSNITVTGPSTIAATNGMGLSLTDVTGANIALNTISSTGSAGAGIALDNVTGTQVTVNNTTTIGTATTNAISIINSNIDTTFNGLAIDTTGADAIVLTDNNVASTATFDGGTIANVTGNVMTAQNPGMVVFNNITANTGITGSGIVASTTTANTAITVTNSTFDATVNDAINLDAANATNITALISGNTLIGANSVVGTTANTATMDITLTGNDFNATTAALDLSSADTSIINSMVTGNTVTSGTFEISAGVGSTINFTNADQAALSTDNDNATVNDAAAGGTVLFNQAAPATP